MKHNEIKWNTMKCEEILALDLGFGVVNYIGIQWNSLKYNGLRWNTMKLYGKQWNIWKYNEMSRITPSSKEIPENTMKYDGIP